ncbi:MAG: hypothetical protein L6U61_10620 [Bacteroidales bacterium]|nr:MAG: hypothetical protein L6U61_10620 [Bacteroidales bacterium]
MDGCLRDASGKVSTADTKGEAADGLKDFISEARRLNSLCGQCRNIVPVDEVFEANGTACYVMEFLDGGSLADYVKAWRAFCWCSKENSETCGRRRGVSALQPHHASRHQAWQHYVPFQR